MFERLIWVIPVTVAGVGLRNPRAGLLVLAACLPFFGSPPGGPYLAALDLAAILAIGTAWRGGRGKPTPLSWPAAAFVAVGLLSLVPSPYWPPDWRPATLAGLLGALPAVETWSALYTWRAALDLALGWGLFLAVGRAFSGRSANALGRSILVGLSGVILLGLVSQAGLVDLGAYRVQAAAGRLHSVFFLSGWLSQYLVLAAPPAIAALLATGRLGRRLALPFATLALVCLGLTLQRGAWLAVLAQLLFCAGAFALRRERRPTNLSKLALRAGAGSALAILVFVSIGAPLQPVLERAGAIEGSLSPRLPYWTAAAEMMVDKPLLGWGLGSFAPAYDLRHPTGEQSGSNTAHSLYLDIAAERGLLGLVSLALLCWGAASCLARPRPGRESMALGIGLALVGALVYGVVQYLFHLKAIAWLLWLLLAAAALTTRAEEPSSSGRAARILLGLVVVLLPIRAIFAQPAAYPGDRAFGWHEPERDEGGPYRWTEGRAAMRIPWEGETLILEFANGHPRAADRPPVEIVVAINGETVKSLSVPGGWEQHAFHVGPALDDGIVLSLDVEPTFRPFSDFRRYPGVWASLDIRSLGVAMREPRWEPSSAAASHGRVPIGQKAKRRSELE